MRFQISRDRENKKHPEGNIPTRCFGKSAD
jgi:hypothetical protein